MHVFVYRKIQEAQMGRETNHKQICPHMPCSLLFMSVHGSVCVCVCETVTAASYVCMFIASLLCFLTMLTVETIYCCSLENICIQHLLRANVANVNANYLVRARYCRYVTMPVKHVRKAESVHFVPERVDRKKSSGN